MPYVMVPVPEEHVVEVMQYVSRLAARKSREPWDRDAVEAYFLAADEGARSLLSLAARTALAGKQITALEAMQSLELKIRDMGRILSPITEAAKSANRLPLVDLVRDERVGPGGRKRSVRCMVMTPEVAEMVRSAELKARELEPHPLDRSTG